jgi:GAF domain-containing protein
MLEGKSVQLADVLTDAEWAHPEAASTMLGVPLLPEGTPIGIFLPQRAEVRPFTEKQIKLVETFADQAVIAIENTLLYRAGSRHWFGLPGRSTGATGAIGLHR